jgi:vancomycin resistance protein YoaR
MPDGEPTRELMGRKTQIAIVTGVVLLVLGAVGAYAYDSSQDGKIADGVTIGGVDVGGMTEAEAKRAVRRQLLAPLRHSLRVGYDGESWVLPGKTLKLHADLDRAVEEAVDTSRDGGLPGRLVRYVTGDGLDEQVPAEVTYSQRAVNRFVREIAAAVDREARDATVEASGSSLAIVPAEYGRKLRDHLLTRQLGAAVLNADADHTIAASGRT